MLTDDVPSIVDHLCEMGECLRNGHKDCRGKNGPG